MSDLVKSSEMISILFFAIIRAGMTVCDLKRLIKRHESSENRAVGGGISGEYHTATSKSK